MDVAATLTIIDSPVEDPAYLYKRLDNEEHPCRAEVVLDLVDGALSARYWIGDAVEEEVAQHRRLTWRIPVLVGTAVDDLLADLAPLAQRVLNGSRIVYDGEGHKGTQPAGEAVDARHAIADVCARMLDEQDPSLTVGEWTAEDWFAEGKLPAVAATDSDERLAELAAEECRAATDDGTNGWTVLSGIDEFLRGLREKARDAYLEQTADVHEASEALKRKQKEIQLDRDLRILAMRQWLSLRQIAAALDLEHPTVVAAVHRAEAHLADQAAVAAELAPPAAA